jgi:hypothetical protein
MFHRCLAVAYYPVSSINGGIQRVKLFHVEESPVVMGLII